MDETKQDNPSRSGNAAQTTYWGTLLLNIILLAMYAYAFKFVLVASKTLITDIASVIFALVALVTVIGLVLTIRHRQEQGLKFTYFPVLAMVITLAALFQGRAVSGSVSVLIISLVGFFWLFPRRSWYLYIIPAAVTVILVWVFEWIGPVWRQPMKMAEVGPAGAIAFAVILGVLMIVWARTRIISFLQNSIRNRLTAIVLAVTVPLLIGITTYISLRAGSEIETESQLHLQEKNGALATNLSTWLEQHRRTLEGTAILPDIVSMDADRQLPILKAVAESHPNLFLVQTVGLDGMNVARNDDAEPKDYSDRQWFLGAKNGNAITYEVVISRTTGRPALNMSMPIRNAYGQIVGVFSIVSELDEISRDVITTEEGNIAFIVDDKNLVVAHPDPSYTEGELYDMSAYPPVTALRNGEPGAITFTDDGGVVWRAYTSEMDNGWVIVTQQTQNELLLPVRQFQIPAIILIVVGTLAVFVLAWFTIRRSLQPISTLTQTVTAIANGDLNREVKINNKDEIGELASAFNVMTSQVRGLITTLEDRVAERTHSLELAAEVGRSVSQVRELDVMLADAVEIIRSRFNLYYTQVYIANTAQNALLLRAGTGAVGAELLGRGHRLPLNTGSINGRAAIEKRSIVIADATASATFRPNPLLPDTRSEMAVPLLVGETVVGVLDMQSEHPGALSEEGLAAYEALAGQLAVAIQNANLLAETEEARAEVETQARRMVRANWTEYLDAIHKPERMGFAYEGNQIARLDEPVDVDATSDGHVVSAPISVTGEPLGALVVEMDEQSHSSQNQELVKIVAQRVAQQLESLRLLDSAERYRIDAEEASRRITREGWKEFMNVSAAGNVGYRYNLNEVEAYAVDDNQKVEGSASVLPVKIRDEKVGEIVVDGLDTSDRDSVELANAVAERLASHLESLRQFNQTQSALAQSEKLFEASRRLAQVTDLQELIKATVEMLNIPAVNRASLGVFNYNAAGELESMTDIANWWNGVGTGVAAIGTSYSAESLKVLSVFVSPIPVFFNDTFHDARMGETELKIISRLNVRAVAILPLFQGTLQIGVLRLQAEEPHNFSQEETRLFTVLAPQIATVLENRRQFERAQQQAEREGLLNTISQKIQSATTVEAVLQIAARELGRALGAPMTIAQLGMKNRAES